MTQDGSRLPASGETPPPDPARRFTGGEVSDILRRAADAEGRSDLPAATGVTLDDLLEAARQAGLDPDVVRRSSAITLPPGRGPATLVFGAPDRREVRAVLPGVRLPEDREAMVEAVERSLGRRGGVVKSGPDDFAWLEDHLAGRTRVELTPKGGGTEIRVSADRTGHYLGAWFLGLLGWALLSGLTPVGSLGLLPKIISFVAAPILLVRPWWSRRDKGLRRRLEQLTLDLAGFVEEGGRALPPG
jgi:hypothetical protein